MDELDCRILDELQNNFPLCESPYEIIAERLHIPSRELWDRTRRLIEEGIIRRIGASLDSHKLGYTSTLAAVSCPKADIDKAAEIIGQFPEVTHSYLRNDDFNIWFTLIAHDRQTIENILEQIRTALSLEHSQILNLPVKRLFKLNARFKTTT
ncbi:MAG: AsnC family transcriptional regulator [Sedimentisphaerales bacterium]|nr:AsnC family transcriptional regulator [Sedimentisphaerales bacterium]